MSINGLLRVLAGVVLLLWASPASAALALGTVTAQGANCTGASASTPTFAHTVDAGSDRLLTVTIPLYTATGTISTVKWNTTESLTLVGASVGAHRVEIWQLINPTNTTANIDVAIAGDVFYFCAGAQSWTGAHQTTPTAGFASATGTSTGPTVDVSSAAGDIVLDALDWNSNSVTLTTGAGQTQRHNIAHATDAISGASSTEGGAGTVTMSGTLSSSSDWAIAGVSITAAGGGGGTGPKAGSLSSQGIGK